MVNSNISNFLLSNGIKLHGTEFALDRAMAIELIALLENENVFILGGDVYVRNDGEFIPSYDNWYSQKDSCSISESIDKSRRYVSSYQGEGDNYFVIVY